MRGKVMGSKGTDQSVRWRSAEGSILLPLLVFFASATIAGRAYILPIAMTSQAYVDSR